MRWFYKLNDQPKVVRRLRRNAEARCLADMRFAQRVVPAAKVKLSARSSRLAKRDVALAMEGLNDAGRPSWKTCCRTARCSAISPSTSRT